MKKLLKSQLKEYFSTNCKRSYTFAPLLPKKSMLGLLKLDLNRGGRLTERSVTLAGAACAVAFTTVAGPVGIAAIGANIALAKITGTIAGTFMDGKIRKAAAKGSDAKGPNF